MRSSTVLLHFGLGLLSSLIVAANSLHGVSDDLPVYSTLDYAFTLASTQPDGAHVVLNGDGTPVVTYDRRSSTQFRLTDGNLTAVASKLTAIYGPVGLPLPPLLIPVLLKKDPPPDAILPFLAVHSNRQGKGSDPLTLTAVGEGEVFYLFIYFSSFLTCGRDQH